MTDRLHIFHLAIPAADLDESQAYYVDKLGCRLARRYDDRITLDFFGDQVVCHLAPDAVDPAPKIYPRHFGVTFRNEADFDAVIEKANKHGCRFFRKPTVRFAGRQEEHRTFFLIDPANNLLEFKFYHDQSMMY